MDATEFYVPFSCFQSYQDDGRIIWKVVFIKSEEFCYLRESYPASRAQ